MPAPTFTTTPTVSSPLNLDSFRPPKRELEPVRLNGSSKKIRPKPKVTLTSLTPNNSGTLRKINRVVIPIVYSDKFYKEVLDPSLDDINKLIYYGDIPVGGICCRFESLASTSKEKPPTLVILTLGILAPYRSQSLGTALLTSALHAALQPSPPPPPLPSTEKTNSRGSLPTHPARKSVRRAMAHVQVGNEGAKRFYERLGFVAGETVDNYYSRMEPQGAALMVCEDTGAALGEKAPNGTA